MKTIALLVIITVAGALIVFAALQSDDDPGSQSRLGATITPPPAAIEIIAPTDGSPVNNPINLRMAVGGVRLAPSSETPALGVGHLHIIIDGQVPPPGDVIQPDKTHLDLSDGSFRVTLPTLSPGPHTLIAVFTSSTHIVPPSPLTHSITITVTQ